MRLVSSSFEKLYSPLLLTFRLAYGTVNLHLEDIPLLKLLFARKKSYFISLEEKISSLVNFFYLTCRVILFAKMKGKRSPCVAIVELYFLPLLFFPLPHSSVQPGVLPEQEEKQGSKKQWLEGVSSFLHSFCTTYQPCSRFPIPFSHHALGVCVSKIKVGIMSCLHKLGGISLFSEWNTSVKIFFNFFSNLLYSFSIGP